MNSLFEIPHEVLSTISSVLPCREHQIYALTALISISGAVTRNIVIHGLEATGKTAITKAALEELSKFYSSVHDDVISHNSTTTAFLNGEGSKNDENNNSSRDKFRYAYIKNHECIDARQLFEHTIASISKALGVKNDTTGLLASLSDFVVQIQRILESWVESGGKLGSKRRFVLIFDGIDKQINNFSLPYSFPAALARMGEFVPNFTIIFITTTSPQASFLSFPGVPSIYFPSYTKSEFLTIISLTKPKPALFTHEDTLQTWCRFTAAVYDSLSKHSGRDILSFRRLCLRMWPIFVRPILSNELEVNPFSRLLVANRSLFQNDYSIVHDIITSSSKEKSPSDTSTILYNQRRQHTNIADLLPTCSRLLLIACYLASFSPARNDAIIFMKLPATKRRKKGGGTALTSSRSGTTKSRKIPRKLLGAQAFVLERMLAIFHTICAVSDLLNENAENGSVINGKAPVDGSGDVQTGIATLISLRLLTRTGNLNTGDVLDAGTKYRVMIGWVMARNIARSVGVEIENYLDD